MALSTSQLLSIVETLINQFATNGGVIEWAEGSERYRGHTLPQLLAEHRLLSAQAARETGGVFHLAAPLCE